MAVQRASSAAHLDLGGTKPFSTQMASAPLATRVTDETADVKILALDNRIFTTPNRIEPEDFTGWVQERNLYAFTSFDPKNTALLESHEPGEPPQQGGELYVRLGRGQYVDTVYSWFRQLPAGIPGAYRMFANLVTLGARNQPALSFCVVGRGIDDDACVLGCDSAE